MSAVDERPRSGKSQLAWLIVVMVAAVLFGYVTVQAVGNLLGVQNLIDGYNKLVEGSGVATRETPWALLVADVAIAPLAFLIALLVSRRQTAVRSILVFAVGFCAVSALWFTLSQLVVPYVTINF